MVTVIIYRIASQRGCVTMGGGHYDDQITEIRNIE